MLPEPDQDGLDLGPAKGPKDEARRSGPEGRVEEKRLQPAGGGARDGLGAEHPEEDVPDEDGRLAGAEGPDEPGLGKARLRPSGALERAGRAAAGSEGRACVPCLSRLRSAGRNAGTSSGATLVRPGRARLAAAGTDRRHRGELAAVARVLEDEREPPCRERERGLGRTEGARRRREPEGGAVRHEPGTAAGRADPELALAVEGKGGRALGAAHWPEGGRRRGGQVPLGELRQERLEGALREERRGLARGVVDEDAGAQAARRDRDEAARAEDENPGERVCDGVTGERRRDAGVGGLEALPVGRRSRPLRRRTAGPGPTGARRRRGTGRRPRRSGAPSAGPGNPGAPSAPPRRAGP